MTLEAEFEDLAVFGLPEAFRVYLIEGGADCRVDVALFGLIWAWRRILRCLVRETARLKREHVAP